MDLDLTHFELSQEVRKKIWESLEAHARIGNLKPNNIRGNGMPDLFAKWIVEDFNRASVLEAPSGFLPSSPVAEG